MAQYDLALRILTSDELIEHIKALSGYVEEEQNNRLIKMESGSVAVLEKDGTPMGAFIVFEKKHVCIRPYYYDEFEGGAVGTKELFGVPLAYQHLKSIERVALFNQNALDQQKQALKNNFKNVPLYEIKSLKPFKFKNASKA